MWGIKNKTKKSTIDTSTFGKSISVCRCFHKYICTFLSIFDFHDSVGHLSRSLAILHVIKQTILFKRLDLILLNASISYHILYKTHSLRLYALLWFIVASPSTKWRRRSIRNWQQHQYIWGHLSKRSIKKTKRGFQNKKVYAPKIAIN